MLRHVGRTLSLIALALLLFVTPGRGQSGAAPSTTPSATASAAPTTATTTAPVEEMVDNPHYLAWSKYAIGTEVELEMKLIAGGQRVTTHITQRMSELTPQKAVVEAVAIMNVPGLTTTPQPQKQTLTFNAKVPKSEADRSELPAGAKGDSREVGRETIDAAGASYDCKVIEFTGGAPGVDAKGRRWRSNKVPGGLVKMESSSGGGNIKMEMVITKVTTN